MGASKRRAELVIVDLAHQVIAGSACTVRDADNSDGDTRIKETGLRPGEKLHEKLSIRAATAAGEGQRDARACRSAPLGRERRARPRLRFRKFANRQRGPLCVWRHTTS